MLPVVFQLSRDVIDYEDSRCTWPCASIRLRYSNTVVIVSHNKVGCPVIVPSSVLLQFVNKSYVRFVSTVCSKFIVSYWAFWKESLLVVCRMQMYVHWICIQQSPNQCESLPVNSFPAERTNANAKWARSGRRAQRGKAQKSKLFFPRLPLSRVSKAPCLLLALFSGKTRAPVM